MRTNLARPDIRENEEEDKQGSHDGIRPARRQHGDRLLIVIEPHHHPPWHTRGTHFAGKLTDQYLTPTRTAERRHRDESERTNERPSKFQERRAVSDRLARLLLLLLVIRRRISPKNASVSLERGACSLIPCPDPG